MTMTTWQRCPTHSVLVLSTQHCSLCDMNSTGYLRGERYQDTNGNPVVIDYETGEVHAAGRTIPHSEQAEAL